MLTCLILAATLAGTPAADVDRLSRVVEIHAQALRADATIDGDYLIDLAQFSEEAEALSAALRQTDVPQDLPCIFRGIGEDARLRATELQTGSGHVSAMARSGLDALLDDAILLAPQARAALSADDSQP